MPRYSDELINEIFSQNDIVDYVSQYVRLKKNGRDYSGLCPFHKEKSPSFHVNQEKQLFHCFGCGAGGNLVQFVMKSEGLDFVEALKLMADRAGIALPEDGGGADDEQYRKKKRIYLMNKTAAKLYYDCLTSEEAGKPGLEYFAERKIQPKTITRYGLGYAPEGFDYLKTRLNKQGFSDNELLEAGLCVARGDKIYDKFRGRVIFPIIDLRSNVIGFGGRILNGEERNGFKPPKYLNSSETPVFNKGSNLFSLNLAKKTSEQQCILCEGYMDVISVNQAGVEAITATLGTALTENQAKLLMKYTGEILLCYDSDEAGMKATRRAIDIINSVGGKCRVMHLKGAKDPDEYIKANGIEFFKKAMRDALPSTEYLLKGLKNQYNIENPDGKVMFLQEAAKVLASLANAIEADAYAKKLSDETDISKEAIYAEMKKYKNKDKLSQASYKNIREEKNKKSEFSGIADAELKLLSLIINSRQCYNMVQNDFKPQDYSSDILRRLADIVYTHYENNEIIDAPIVTNRFSGAEAEIVSKIFCNLETYADEKNTVTQLVSTIKLERLEKEINKAISENQVGKVKELLDLRMKLEGKKQNVRFREQETNS